MNITGISGRGILVTGAARGIGEGIAKALAEADARLALVDTNGEQLERVSAGMPGCTSSVLDISDPEAVEAAVEQFEDEIGPLSGLVNVAGIQHLAELVDQPLKDFQDTFRVNVEGTYIVTRAVGQRMAERGEGRIVTVTSNAGRVPRVRQGAYCASKAALSHLMRVFALELAASGVRCNSVAPGSTETEMIRKMAEKMDFREQLIRGSLENFRVGVPLGKNASVEDVAWSVLFLLSDQSSHITMHELVIDGGGTLGA